MPSYVSPARYRTMGLGIDLSAKSDAMLAALLASASAEINRYCAAPAGHDYRGASVAAESHVWNVGNQYQAPSGRLWPKHAGGVMPITSCTQIDIYTTKTNYVRFDSSQIFVSGLGWVEPVAAPITTALFTSIPPWLLTTPMAYIDYTYGLSFTSSDEPLVDSGDHLTYYAQNEWWTDDDVTATLNGTSVDLTSGTPDATINRDKGTITFAEHNAPGDLVVASYNYKLPEEIRVATGIVVTDMLGFSNINASGLTGLSGIRVEEIELRQSARAGFNNYNMHPVARMLIDAYSFASIA